MPWAPSCLSLVCSCCSAGPVCCSDGWCPENRPIGKTRPLRRVRSDVVVAGAVYFGVSLTRLTALSCLGAYKSDRVPVGTFQPPLLRACEGCLTPGSGSRYV